MINTETANATASGLPWFRYGMVWLVIAFPIASVVFGFVIFYLASTSNHALVVDNYYKLGKTINRRVERDRFAARLGLEATVGSDAAGIWVDVGKHSAGDDASDTFHWPATVRLKWVHAIDGTFDGSAVLQAVGGSRYRLDGAELPSQGAWRMHLDSPIDIRWRLVSERISLGSTEPVVIRSQSLPMPESAS